MTERWKKDGEERSETTWVRVVCWGYQAETIVRILEKGDLVYVEGKITNRSFEKEGQKVNVTEVEAREVLRLSSSRNAGTSEQASDE